MFPQGVVHSRPTVFSVAQEDLPLSNKREENIVYTKNDEIRYSQGYPKACRKEKMK